MKKGKTCKVSHEDTHSCTHILKNPINSPDHITINKMRPTERTKTEYRKRANTHIWFEKEEARMIFLGNELQNIRREKRKHVCGQGSV